MALVKKRITKKPMAKKMSMSSARKEKPIGEVTHFFGKISVAIVKFSKPVRVGATVRFVGMHTEFTQTIASMQYDHEPIAIAKKGKEVGIKVKKDVHEGNLVYAA
jgi:putative protease